MGISRGKQFEDVIKKTFSTCPSVSIDRFQDPQAGYAGIRNICDFVMYHKPNIYYLECKTHYGNTLSLKGDITENQWEGLKEKSKITGVIAGVVVWFIDHDLTVFVPIQELVRLQEQGNKSLNVKHILNHEVEYVYFVGKKKRVLFDYDVFSILANLATLSEKHWGGLVYEQDTV